MSENRKKNNNNVNNKIIALFVCLYFFNFNLRLLLKIRSKFLEVHWLIYFLSILKIFP